jgi:hypothetical protein
MGVCTGAAQDPDEAWTCVCDAGWARFPAVGAAARCSLNPALQRALCAVTLLCSVSILLGTARAVSGGHTTLLHNVPIIGVCVLCLAADALQLADPAGRVLLSDLAASLLKLGAFALLSDGVIRVTFLRYRTVALATVTAAGPSPSLLIDAEASLRSRTWAEVGAVAVLFAVSFGVGMSGVPTRSAVAVQLAYWVISPLIVVNFVTRTTRSLLRELTFLRGNVSPELAERVETAIVKAITVRNITLRSYVLIIVPPLFGLVLLPYADQFGHWIVELGFLAGMVGSALNQRAQGRIAARSRRKLVKKPSRVIGDTKSSATVVPLSAPARTPNDGVGAASRSSQ